jgi:hypothetical protein
VDIYNSNNPVGFKFRFKPFLNKEIDFWCQNLRVHSGTGNVCEIPAKRFSGRDIATCQKLSCSGTDSTSCRLYLGPDNARQLEFLLWPSNSSRLCFVRDPACYFCDAFVTQMWRLPSGNLSDCKAIRLWTKSNIFPIRTSRTMPRSVWGTLRVCNNAGPALHTSTSESACARALPTWELNTPHVPIPCHVPSHLSHSHSKRKTESGCDLCVRKSENIFWSAKSLSLSGTSR